MENTHLRHSRTHSILGQLVTRALHGPKYSHIFKVRDKWILVISDSPNVQGAGTEGFYNTKPEAKARAAALGAKPWNY